MPTAHSVHANCERLSVQIDLEEAKVSIDGLDGIWLQNNQYGCPGLGYREDDRQARPGPVVAARLDSYESRAGRLDDH